MTTPQQPESPTAQSIRRDIDNSDLELSTKTLFKNPNNDTKKKLITTIITLFADIVLPVVLYFVLKKWIDPVWALLAAAGPAFLSVVVKLAWKRQVDLIGLLVFCAFAITGIVAITTHSARILLMEKSVVTAILGLVFWLTLIPFRIPSIKRKKHQTPSITVEGEEVDRTKQPAPPAGDGRVKPFLYYALKQLIPLGKMDIRISGYEIGRYEWFWLNLPSFKKHVRFLTALWGVGLLAEFGGRLAMVLSPMSTDNVVLYANVYFAVLIAILLVISVFYGLHAKKGLLAEIDDFLAVRRLEMTESGAVKRVDVQGVDDEGKTAHEYERTENVQVATTTAELPTNEVQEVRQEKGGEVRQEVVEEERQEVGGGGGEVPLHEEETRKEVGGGGGGGGWVVNADALPISQ